MEANSVIADLILKGGVWRDVRGSSPEEIYKAVSAMVPLPEGMSPEHLRAALCERERLLSTAVGNGIALPHARAPVMRSAAEQEICVVYPAEPLDMNAPDELKVRVMFVLLTYNAKTHLEILSSLVKLARKREFRELLDSRPDAPALAAAIKELESR